MATLLLMQARGRVTAAELADELEVSVATARRDLESLSTAGVPVYPQPGRGGGWSLVGCARTDLSGLTATEAPALFLLVGPAASVTPEAKSVGTGRQGRHLVPGGRHRAGRPLLSGRCPQASRHGSRRWCVSAGSEFVHNSRADR